METFWEQTERSYTNALEARVEARKRERHRDQVLAYNSAALAGAAFAGKLGKFEKHFKPEPNQAQGRAEILATLRELQSKGVPMSIKRVVH